MKTLEQQLQELTTSTTTHKPRWKLLPRLPPQEESTNNYLLHTGPEYRPATLADLLWLALDNPNEDERQHFLHDLRTANGCIPYASAAAVIHEHYNQIYRAYARHGMHVDETTVNANEKYRSLHFTGGVTASTFVYFTPYRPLNLANPHNPSDHHYDFYDLITPILLPLLINDGLPRIRKKNMPLYQHKDLTALYQQLWPTKNHALYQPYYGLNPSQLDFISITPREHQTRQPNDSVLFIHEDHTTPFHNKTYHRQLRTLGVELCTKRDALKLFLRKIIGP